ncbi:MAG: 3-oxoacyl-ACP reductase FabG [Alicyclobacillaceae bacterium]|nr:3-oxoacyl-ACP reductase FabG [Alicyclobacillaceae bacterium]
MHPQSTTRPLYRHVALVTGASGDIGREIAMFLARAGAHVALHYRTRRDSALDTVAHCRHSGVEAIAVEADLTQSKEVEAMINQVNQSLGPIQILVNAAGRTKYGLLSETEEEEWDDLIDINLKAVYLTCKFALPTMIRRRYGRIINIASIWGESGAAGEVAYSAAKGGVIAFTRALAKEVSRTGVTVNAVSPGAVDTGMLRDFSEAEKEELRERIPTGRLGTPADVARAVLFLALPDNDWITGQTLSPNGGQYP